MLISQFIFNHPAVLDLETPKKNIESMHGAEPNVYDSKLCPCVLHCYASVSISSMRVYFGERVLQDLRMAAKFHSKGLKSWSPSCIYGLDLQSLSLSSHGKSRKIQYLRPMSSQSSPSHPSPQVIPFLPLVPFPIPNPTAHIRSSQSNSLSRPDPRTLTTLSSY
jgi:hypothetical protein